MKALKAGKKRGMGVTAVAVLALFLVSVGLNPISSRLLRSKIESALREKCPSCKLEIARLGVSWLRAQVLAEGVRFTSDASSNVACDFSVAKVDAHFKPFSYLGEVPVVKKLDLTGLHVTVREKANSPPSPRPDFPPPGYAFKGFPPARVGEIRVHDGGFTYEQIIFGKLAKLDVHHVEAEAGSFVTRQSLLAEGDHPRLEMKATALLENSGKVRLDVEFDPFAEKNHDQIVLEVQSQRMAELNPLFGVTDGIRLTGVLENARASMDLREGHLSGTLQASYENLQFKYDTTPDRGKIASSLAQIFHALEVSKTRPKEGDKTLPESRISERRTVREPITKFLLRGLKDAAQKILSS